MAWEVSHLYKMIMNGRVADSISMTLQGDKRELDSGN